MPALHADPVIIELNTEEGYDINPLTGDSIRVLQNAAGDTIRTGVPVALQHRRLSEGNYGIEKVVPVEHTLKSPAHSNVTTVRDVKERTVDEVIEKSIPLRLNAGVRVRNSIGDTVLTGVPLPCRGKPVAFKASELSDLSKPDLQENADVNLVNLKMDEGLNSNHITCLLEDSRGNIWFGTGDRGISRFNGEHFIHYPEFEDIAFFHVNCLFEDSRGNIWIGTRAGGLIKFDGERFLHYTDRTGLITNDVRCLHEDSEGDLWLGTSGGGVGRLRGDSILHLTPYEGLPHWEVFSILEDKDGMHWFGTDGGGVYRFDGSSFIQHLDTDSARILNGASGILQDREGNLWFGGWNGGACRYDGDSFTFLTLADGLSSMKVISMHEDSRGNIWLGTFDEGICVYDGRSITRYGQNEGFGHYIIAILEDGGGRLWFGSRWDGAFLYDPGSFVRIRDQDGAIGNRITSLLNDRENKLWFGTFREGVNMYDGSNFHLFKEHLDFLGEEKNIHSLLEDRHGNIWMGTGYGHAIRYDGKVFEYFWASANWKENLIHCMLEDREGNIWFGSNLWGLTMYNGEYMTIFPGNHGLAETYIMSIMEARNGDLWFATNGHGVAKYNEDGVVFLTEKEGLSNNIAGSLFEDSFGNIWIGTIDGVSVFNGSEFRCYTEETGLSSNGIRSIREDGDQNIWVATNQGLNQFIPVQNSAAAKDSLSKASSIEYRIRSFEKPDGLFSQVFNINCSSLDSMDRLWWGSPNGLIMLDLNRYSTPADTPVVQLEQIEINGRFIDFRNAREEKGPSFEAVERFGNIPVDLELPSDHNRLSFRFAAIDWAAPHKLRYSTRMEGLKEDWGPPSRETEAEYRGLKHGNYTFWIRAIGAAGEWSEPYGFSFTIRPPWWQSWLARSIYIILALALIVGFVRWRTASLKRRQKELEKIVKDRTAEISFKNEELQQQKEEVEAQRDEIEAQRDLVTHQKEQISEQKQAMTDSIQYASRIQTAILPPDEVLRYLLPKHFILYKPRDIVSGDFYWFSTRDEKVVIAIADCTGHGVPGAFMSMLGSALLNDAINKLESLQANLLLNELRDMVMASLRQTGKEDEAKDGMDIALCILDKKKMSLQYAGGYNPLYIIRNGELIEVKADKMPIGISDKAGRPFTNQEIELKKEDALYMFSDGYVDQFGGPRGKKFMVKKFKELLLDIQDRIMFDQKRVLEEALDEWMGVNYPEGDRFEQVDDIIVMGIKI